MLTLTDVIERLKKIDEVSLLEILNISSEDILDRFGDYVEDQYEILLEELEEESEDSNTSETD